MKCPICCFEKQLVHIYGSHYEEACSQFCDETSKQEKEAYLTLQIGDFGVYPCSECGCPMEDVYEGPGTLCSKCYPKVQLREAQQLLKLCLPFVPADLKVRIERL